MKRFENITYCIITSLIMACVSVISKDSFGQTSDKHIMFDSASKDSVVLAWLQNLYEEGVKVEGDSVTVSAETTRLLTDEPYRLVMYPKTYKWEGVVFFIQRQDIKRACWFMLNLYLDNDKNKELALSSLMTYDKLLRMDKILTNTFYTYVLADPEIGNLADGRFKVTAPHIMEKKLNALREILFYLDKYGPKKETVK